MITIIPNESKKKTLGYYQNPQRRRNKRPAPVKKFNFWDKKNIVIAIQENLTGYIPYSKYNLLQRKNPDLPSVSILRKHFGNHAYKKALKAAGITRF